MDFNYPVNVRFECNQCGLCCGDTAEKARHIRLLENEAEDISAKTNLPIKEFATKTTGSPPYVYEVKKTSQGKCIFLKNAQCNIYGHRPLICRYYPFELKFDQDKESYVFSYTLECPTIGTGRTLSRKDFEELFLLAKQRLP